MTTNKTQLTWPINCKTFTKPTSTGPFAWNLKDNEEDAIAVSKWFVLLLSVHVILVTLRRLVFRMPILLYKPKTSRRLILLYTIQELQNMYTPI